MRNGKLNKREVETVRRAWYILSEMTEWMENDAEAKGEDVYDNREYTATR